MNNKNKIVVISPHRDDAVISIGSFIYDNFGVVTIINIFTRSIGTILDVPDNEVTRIRKSEDDFISRNYSLRFISLGLPDTSLRGVGWDDYNAKIDMTLLVKISSQIYNIIINEQPNNVFIPAAYGLHPDHYLSLLAFSHKPLFNLISKINFGIYCDQQYYYEGNAYHKGHDFLDRYGKLHSYKFNPDWKKKIVSVYKSQLSKERIKLLTQTITKEYFWTVPPGFFIESLSR